MKKSFLFIFVIFTFILPLSFITSEILTEEGLVLGEKIVHGQGIEYGNGENGTIIFEFVEENAILSIGEDKFVLLKSRYREEILEAHTAFANIVSNTEKLAFIELNQQAEIVKAEFTVAGKARGVYSYYFKGELTEQGKKIKEKNLNDHAFNLYFEGEKIELKSGVILSYNLEEGIQIKFPEKFDFSNFNGLINYIKRGQVSELSVLEGEESQLISEEGYLLTKGKIIFKEGRPFVKAGDMAEINWVEIGGVEEGKENSDIAIFIKEEEQGDNFVSFRDDYNLHISNGVDLEPLKINFKEYNTYIKIEEGDSVSLEVGSGANVNINPRYSTEDILDEFGERPIPLVKSKGDIKFYQDSLLFKTSKGEIYINPHEMEEFTTTSPMEWEVLDREEKPILSEDSEKGIALGEEYNLIIDNFNRFSVISKEEAHTINNFGGLEVGFDKRVSYNYPYSSGREGIGKWDYGENGIKKVERFLTDGIFVGDIPEGHRQRIYQKYFEYSNSIGAEQKGRGFEEIIFYGEDDFNTIGWTGNCPEQIGAFASSARGQMGFRVENFPYDTFRHEAAHFAHNNIVANIEKDPSLGENKQIQELYNQLEKAKEEKDKNKIAALWYGIREISQEEELSEFNQQWLAFVPEVKEAYYPTNPFWVKEGEEKMSKEDCNKDNLIVYKEERKLEEENVKELITKKGKESISGPRNGFVRPYGSVNIQEDVATFVEEMSDPEFFKPLLDPSHPYSYSYRGKLDLLYEWKIITEKEYFAVLEEADLL